MTDSDDTPPPPLQLRDDPSAADLARQRVIRKSSLLSLFSFKHRKGNNNNSSPELSSRPTPRLVKATPNPSDVDTTPINLDSSALIDEDIDTDRYEWAVVYENQRGMTAFSIPYYSSASLLPSDPSPFTLPNAPTKRSKQPPVSLDNYPLADGNWQWVSRCWMIDMRSDSGEVQHDGFEYNWMFRQHHWRAQVGSFNAGGWVRRRRWIRLMARPAQPKKSDLESGTTPSTSSMRHSLYRPNRQSMVSSLPSSLNSLGTTMSDPWAHMDPADVWLTEDTEEHWRRCQVVMKRLPTDGLKLELWRLWLGVYHPDHKDKFLTVKDKGKRRDKQWTEDDGPLPSEVSAARSLSKESVAIARRDHVIPLLRKYYPRILQSLVFPDSRAQFLKLLGKANLLSEINTELGFSFASSEVDFWSYANTFVRQFGKEDKLSLPTELKPKDNININPASKNP